MSTREEQLVFCRACQHQKLDLQQGIICGLTSAIATFDYKCPEYQEVPELKGQLEQQQKTKEIYDRMASKGKRFFNYLLDTIFILMSSLAPASRLKAVSFDQVEAHLLIS